MPAARTRLIEQMTYRRSHAYRHKDMYVSKGDGPAMHVTMYDCTVKEGERTRNCTAHAAQCGECERSVCEQCSRDCQRIGLCVQEDKQTHKQTNKQTNKQTHKRRQASKERHRKHKTRYKQRTVSPMPKTATQVRRALIFSATRKHCPLQHKVPSADSINCRCSTTMSSRQR